MELNYNQRIILKAYAKECHPSINHNSHDFQILTKELYIHREQDHITDRGLAYVVAELNYPFMKFLRVHKWERRLKIFLDFAKRVFRSDDELDAYFKAKYKQNLVYNTFGENGQEIQLPKEQLKEFAARMFLDLLGNSSIDWKKIRELFRQAANQIGDIQGDILLASMTSTEEFENYLRQFLEESTKA